MYYTEATPYDEKIKGYTGILQRYLMLTKQGNKDIETLTLFTPFESGHPQSPTIHGGKDTTIEDILNHVNTRFKKNCC